MKHSQDVLKSVLQNNPSLKPLEMRLKLRTLKRFLPLSIRESLEGIIIKNSKLLLAFDHPSAHTYFCKHAQEFGQILHREVKNLGLETSSPLAIRAYVSTRARARFVRNPPKIYYLECAKGTFHNHAKDPQIKAAFERIRACIQAHDRANS
ncbi:hypothetical protein [Helicobacter vulpis]|uniref:hypothetical protein n=1 Tax=Helicobacter vulpis TaxID=2316076 RepID=UPI000EB20D68|nr:hypothetical protein [Helicobacter vulpis]